jgi:hypothetical protein
MCGLLRTLWGTMPSMPRQILGGGPHGGRSHGEKVYRGSRRRVRRIKWSDTTPEFWIFVVLVIFLFFVIVPWMIRHPPDESHSHAPEVNVDTK